MSHPKLALQKVRSKLCGKLLTCLSADRQSLLTPSSMTTIDISLPSSKPQRRCSKIPGYSLKQLSVRRSVSLFYPYILTHTQHSSLLRRASPTISIFYFRHWLPSTICKASTHPPRQPSKTLLHTPQLSMNFVQRSLLNSSSSNHESLLP